MRLSINRSQEMLDAAPALDQLSQQVAQNLGAILQVAGIQKIGLMVFQAPGGIGYYVEEAEPFDNVPVELSNYAFSFIEGISRCMGVFGISSINLNTESEDEAKMLSDTWASLLMPSSSKETISEVIEPEEVTKPKEPSGKSEDEDKAPYIPPLISQLGD